MTFDAPLDGAVEVNLLGPLRVAEVLEELAAERAGCEGTELSLPHLIAVSTAYVNSGHKGDAVRRAHHGLEVRIEDRLATPRCKQPVGPVPTRTRRVEAPSA